MSRILITSTKPRIVGRLLAQRLSLRIQSGNFSLPAHLCSSPPQIRWTCTGSTAKSDSCQKNSPRPPPKTFSTAFWSSRPVWKRAMVNTLRCLVGCTLGDFSAMWYLQAVHPDLGMSAIMAISSSSTLTMNSCTWYHPPDYRLTEGMKCVVASGVTTSLLLETTLLKYGRDRLPWPAAAKTAAGMSLISMLTMEAAQNTVDYHLTGGVIQLDSPVFWSAALISMAAGLAAPLPYNYHRLKRYGRACH